MFFFNGILESWLRMTISSLDSTCNFHLSAISVDQHDLLHLDSHLLVLLLEPLDLFDAKCNLAEPVVLRSEPEDLLLKRLLIASFSAHLQEISQVLDLPLQLFHELVVLRVDLVLRKLQTHVLSALGELQGRDSFVEMVVQRGYSGKQAGSGVPSQGVLQETCQL